LNRQALATIVGIALKHCSNVFCTSAFSLALQDFTFSLTPVTGVSQKTKQDEGIESWAKATAQQ
jgi:hypothetical protein